MVSPEKPKSSPDLKTASARLVQVLKGQKVVSWHQIGPPFWTLTGTLSLVVNIILIAVLFSAGRQLFTIKDIASNQVLGGLYTNFVKMDDAHIRANILVSDTIQVKDTIQVNDTIPVVFDLPLKKDTKVKLTKDTPLNNTTIYLNGAAVPLNLVLPKGTELSINLNMTVPVDQKIPVTLNVPVSLNVPVHLSVPIDIPLNQTQLHEPFVGLQKVVGPYNDLLSGLPASSQQLFLCGKLTGWLCNWYFQVK
jgi:hypothetical protein